MNDQIEWKTARSSLLVLTSYSSKISNLKKKQSILNRLKCVTSEKFPDFLNELAEENFKKFHTEIVNNILSNQFLLNPSCKNYESTFADIHKITKIVYLFSFDQSFITCLSASIKKLNFSSWAVCCFLLEIYLLVSNSRKNNTVSIESVAKTVLKNLKENRCIFFLYLLEYFEVDKTMLKDEFEKELKEVNENNLEILKKLSKIMGYNNDVVVKDTYVALIKPIDGEFDFYDETKSIENRQVDTKAFGAFNPSLLKNIEKGEVDLALLDFISQNIYDRPDLVAKLVKKKKQYDFIPYIARVLAKVYKNKKQFVESLLAATDTEEDLVLIGECVKFLLVTYDEFFGLVNTLLAKDQIEKVCYLLQSCGRFILIQKESNSRAIALIENIKNSTMSEQNRLVFIHTLSLILNPGSSRLTIVEFFRYLFNTTNYRTSTIFSALKASKKLVLIIAAQPCIFDGGKKIAKFIELLTDKAEVVNFYIRSIPILYPSNKKLAHEYIDVLGHIGKTQQEQSSILNRIFSLQIDKEWKMNNLITLLDKYGPIKHFDVYMKVKENRNISPEISRRLFNLSERHHLEEEPSDIDSFDQEMLGMLDDSD